MTMGINQLIFALQYYLLGYLTIEDGEIWAQWFRALDEPSAHCTLDKSDNGMIHTSPRALSATLVFRFGETYAPAALIHTTICILLWTVSICKISFC